MKFPLSFFRRYIAGSPPTPTFINETQRWYGSGATLALTNPAVTSGRLYVVLVHVWADRWSATSVGAGLTLAGGGLTWTRRAQDIHNPNADLNEKRLCAVFTAEATSTTTITDLVLTIAANIIESCNVAIIEVTGHNSGNPVGATCADHIESASGSADPHTLALSATSASDSLVLSSCFVGADGPVSTLTVGSGWTSLHHNTFHYQRRIEYIEGAVSSVAYAHADWTHFVSTLGIEIT